MQVSKPGWSDAAHQSLMRWKGKGLWNFNFTGQSPVSLSPNANGRGAPSLSQCTLTGTLLKGKVWSWKGRWCMEASSLDKPLCRCNVVKQPSASRLQSHQLFSQGWEGCPDTTLPCDWGLWPPAPTGGISYQSSLMRHFSYGKVPMQALGKKNSHLSPGPCSPGGRQVSGQTTW